MAAFSENFVSMEISGPDVTDLSFCDLPGKKPFRFKGFFWGLIARAGIIANVREGGDESDIELVKRLVTSYIRKESCIILLTVTCESWYRVLDPSFCLTLTQFTSRL